MSLATQEVFHLSVDCPCGWSGKIAHYRGHLVREHCNVDGCEASAAILVSFGYHSPTFIFDRPVNGRVQPPWPAPSRGADAHDRGEAADSGSALSAELSDPTQPAWPCKRLGLAWRTGRLSATIQVAAPALNVVVVLTSVLLAGFMLLYWVAENL